MARTRGGLAGIWDRNKKIIKPLATLAAGALTGGAGGAIVGGLMNGLDREGKGGIGFDVGKGAIGAATGYGMGKLGGALKDGVMNRLANQALTKASANLQPFDMAKNIGVTGGKGIAAYGAPMPAAANAATTAAAAPGMMARLSGLDGKTITALGQTAVGGMNAYQQQQQNAMQREEMERRRRLEDEDRTRRDAMDPVRARLLAAMFSRLGVS